MIGRRMILVTGLWAIAVLTGCSGVETESRVRGSAVGTCDLIVKFNGKSDDRDFEVPCPASSTVLSILRSSPMLFEMIGQSDTTAFIVSIDGVENEKSLGDNWVYRVNGSLGDTSAGLFPVRPGDTVEWTFGKYQPDD